MTSKYWCVNFDVHTISKDVNIDEIYEVERVERVEFGKYIEYLKILPKHLKMKKVKPKHKSKWQLVATYPDGHIIKLGKVYNSKKTAVSSLLRSAWLTRS